MRHGRLDHGQVWAQCFAGRLRRQGPVSREVELVSWRDGGSGWELKRRGAAGLAGILNRQLHRAMSKVWLGVSGLRWFKLSEFTAVRVRAGGAPARVWDEHRDRLLTCRTATGPCPERGSMPVSDITPTRRGRRPA